MTNRQKGQITISAISLLISILLLAFASFAWLSSNKEVGSGGMQMQVDTTANLIIATDRGQIMTANWSKTLVNLHDNNDPLLFAPCTHDGDYTTYAKGLKYLKNTNQVNYDTGKLDVGDPIWSEVENGVKTNYYLEKVVYIASTGKELPISSLKAEISSAICEDVDGNESDITSGFLMATSVDFYLVSDADVDTFIATVNVATKAPQQVTLLTDSTIPLNTSGYIKVKMRFYFDGALLDGDSNAYINSAAIDTSKSKIGITFTANESQS